MLAITSASIEETRFIVCTQSTWVRLLRTISMIIRACICGVYVHINNNFHACLFILLLLRLIFYFYARNHELLKRAHGIIHFRCICRPSSGGRHSNQKAMNSGRCLYFPRPHLGCALLQTLRTIRVKKWRFSFFALAAPLNVLYLLRCYPTVALVAQFPSWVGVCNPATENACTRP